MNNLYAVFTYNPIAPSGLTYLKGEFKDEKAAVDFIKTSAGAGHFIILKEYIHYPSLDRK